MPALSLRRLFVLSATCLCLGACAYATAIPVDYNSKKDGFRVYDMKPILIVNGQQIAVELIPNYNKAYAVQFGAFLAKQDFSMEIEKGFIKKLDSKQDSTAIIPLLQEIAKNALPGVGKAMAGETKGGIANHFQVYEFVFSDSGSLIGLRPLLPGETGALLRVPTTSLIPEPSPAPGGGPPPPGT
jgi:hypothetical protein